MGIDMYCAMYNIVKGTKLKTLWQGGHVARVDVVIHTQTDKVAL